MAQREYICNKCGMKKDKIIHGEYPETIPSGCEICSGDLIYNISPSGFRRDQTTLE